MSERLTTVLGSLAPAPMRARSRRRRHARPCPCGCGTLGFCAEHKAKLARIRDELQTSAQRRRRNPAGTINGKHNTALRGSGPMCVNPACRQPRIAPAAFCDDCQSEGHMHIGHYLADRDQRATEDCSMTEDRA